MNQAELIARYDGRVPRYTSYPTAPNFQQAFSPARYGAWLEALPEDVALSLYLHVPFCDRLCLYCGCNTSVVRHDAPRRAYATELEHEIDMVAALDDNVITRMAQAAVEADLHHSAAVALNVPDRARKSSGVAAKAGEMAVGVWALGDRLRDRGPGSKTGGRKGDSEHAHGRSHPSTI